MAQMRALDTPDPFNDDFYYHNAMRRKQEKSRREALMGLQPNANVSGGGSPWCMGRRTGVFGVVSKWFGDYLGVGDFAVVAC